MTEAYKELMGRITVTGAMRQRILNTLQETIPLRRRSRRALVGVCAAAACLVVVIASIIPGQSPVQPSDSSVSNVVADIAEVSSLQALSDTVGFPMEEVTSLPFSPADTQYAAYYGQLAQVTYQGDGQTITFRKIAGSEDPSGDYNSYADLETLTVGDVSAALKGSNGQFFLALWEADGYSCSLQSSNGYSVAVWLDMLQSIS